MAGITKPSGEELVECEAGAGTDGTGRGWSKKEAPLFAEVLDEEEDIVRVALTIYTNKGRR